MHPRSQRRVHGAEFKAQVLAECQQPGASVAAIALAHGLNVNLVRKWLVGRGIKRTGLAAPKTVSRRQQAAIASSTPSASSLQFVPVQVMPEVAPAVPADAASAQAGSPGLTDIHIELSRGATQLRVRWPSTQAAACTAWLRELAAMALKD